MLKSVVYNWRLCIALLVFASLSIHGLMAEDAIYVRSATTDSVAGNQPAKSKSLASSHWAVAVDAGVNWFDGDFKDVDKPFPYYPALGVGFTYNFNGTWGLGASYAFSKYKTTGDGTKTYPNAQAFCPDTLLMGQMHRAQAYVMFDIINMWRPYGKKVFAANLFAGVGAAFFNRECYYAKADVNFEQPLFDAPGKYEMTPLFLFGADCQFNISPSFSLGLKTTYNLFTRDDLDARIQGTNNDGIVDLTLSLRYKIGARKGAHVSNESAYGELLTKVDQQLEEKIVETVIREVITVQEAPRKHEVEVVRRDTVVIESVRVEYQTPQKETHYLYYDLNTSILSDASLNTIQQVAAKMMDNEELGAEIVGYGDNTGSVEYNEKLTEIRANNVRDELINEYGISSDRIICYSGGIIEGKRKGKYSPNRRVEIRLLPTEEFKVASQRVPAKKTTVAQSVKTETTDKKSVNLDDVTQKNAKVLIVEAGMTLSSIAMAEYGNAHCWIYIYEANKKTISDPSKLQVGQKVMIPVLTSAQKASVKNVGF
jgi:outer membrane protein OmpA-like peptidoglycan-associated protein